MTTSRLAVGLLVLALGASGTAGAQSLPQDLPWVVAQFQGSGDWTSRLPQLLTRDWESLPPHRLTDEERRAVEAQARNAAAIAAEAAAAKAAVDRDRRRLSGTLTDVEAATLDKTVATQNERAAQIRRGEATGFDAPRTLALRRIAVKDPPLADAEAPQALAQRTGAVWVITGRLREVGDRLDVVLGLWSAWERRELASWQAVFRVDEAPARMAEAADALRATLLGRPWSGVSVTSPLSGARLRLGGVWYTLPWVDLTRDPGDLEVVFEAPGRDPEVLRWNLVAGQRLTVALGTVDEALAPLQIVTDPPGARVYADSRFLGLSPVTLPRPLAQTRLRAELEGRAPLAWEVGPETPSPTVGILEAPQPPVEVTTAKTRFYDAAFWFASGLAVSSFLGAWQAEAAAQTALYTWGTEGGQRATAWYWTATSAYAVSSVLTTGVFVWMIQELEGYLGAARSTLP